MNRRSMLAGLLGAAAGTVPGARLLAQTGQPGDLAGCMAEPGIALFVDLFQGRPALNFQELLPGADWQLFSSPYATVSFLFPPDWTGQVLYASTFSQNAAPIWTSNIPQAGGVLSARVVSPDSTALWEYAVGSLSGVALTIEQALAIAEGGVLGDGYVGSRLCLSMTQNVTGGVDWLTAIERNGLLVMTNGTLFADASGLSPFSVITYYSLVAPQASYEQVMRGVFIPIQWQMVRVGGGDPTPTPTP